MVYEYIKTIEMIGEAIIIGGFILIGVVGVLQMPDINSVWGTLPIGRVPSVREGYINFGLAILTLVTSGVVLSLISSNSSQ